MEVFCPTVFFAQGLEALGDAAFAFGGDVENSGWFDTKSEHALAAREHVSDVHQQEGFAALGRPDPEADFVWADDAFQQVIAWWRGIEIVHPENKQAAV